MTGISSFWAKSDPFQSVVTHGIVSGTAAQVLTESFLCSGTRLQLRKGLNLSEQQLVPFIGYFVSLHDIGKIHWSFQAKDPQWKEMLRKEDLQGQGTPDPGFRHETESRRAVERIWTRVDRKNGRRLAEILNAHHQGKQQNALQRPADSQWQIFQDQFEEEMRRRFYPEFCFPQFEPASRNVISALLLGIVILSDWIASGDFFAHAEDWPDLQNTARSRAETFLEESGLAHKPEEFGERFCQGWPSIPQGGERQLQSKTEKMFCGGESRYSVMLLEAPMGEGKTEAGVYAALKMARQWGKNGFYVALPTSATANQMVGRMRDLLTMHRKDESVRLLHAMAWMVDEESSCVQEFSTEENAFARNWLLPMRRGLLSPYAVGTVDQAMMAVMFIKYGVLRLLGLAGKTLIIDEIHAYDTYMQNILERLLEWCKALEIPVVLLSATLPPEKKQKLLGVYTSEPVPEGYPAITAVDDRGHIHREPVQKVAKQQVYGLKLLPLLTETEEIARYAVQQTENGGCLCVMLNTVGQAQQVYAAIRDLGFPGRLMLFHSRFPARRREEIEKTCIRLFGKHTDHRPGQAILVATQVVEQSLDVDFDYFISAAAPIDLLIQRMGRQFRHAGTPRPEGLRMPVFTVLTPSGEDFGPDSFVYPESLLRRAVQLLKERETIRVPEDIAGLVADGYDSSKIPPEELESWMEHLIDDSMKGAMADPYKLYPPSKKFRPLSESVIFDDLEHQSYLSAQTRLSEPTVRVALLEEALYRELLTRVRSGRLPVQDVSTAESILECSVSVRKKKYDLMAKKYDILDITGDKLLTETKILEKDNPILRDDPELGVVWKEEKQ